MKKRTLTLVSVLCLIVMLFSLASCQKESENKDEHDHNHGEESEIVYHTISFNSNGGSPVDSIKIQHGYGTGPLEIPIYNNHIFLYWSYEGSEWLHEYKEVKSDMTLTAVWKAADEVFGIEPTDDGVMITSIKYQRPEGFTHLYVPYIINGKAVTAIGKNAFEGKGDNYTKNIHFPKSVTRIGEGAFADVASMNIYFEGTITHIEESAFENCSSLKAINLAPGMEAIPYSAFSSCSSIKVIQIPQEVKTIEENAFEKCSSLKTVVLPKSLTEVKQMAFRDCPSITSVFYEGSKADFDKIDIDLENDALLDAKMYFYSTEQPTEEGNFWHYAENGEIAVWGE